METGEILGPTGWLVAFQLLNCTADAEQLTQSAAFDGVAGMGMDAENGEVRILFELEGSGDEVILRAVELAWTLLEAEAAEAEMHKMVLTGSGAIEIDCTEQLFELQKARRAFDSL